MEAWKVFLMFIPISCLIVYYWYHVNIKALHKTPSRKQGKAREFSTKEWDAINKHAKAAKVDHGKSHKELAESTLEAHYKSLVSKKNAQGIWDIPGVPDKYLKSPRVDGILPLSKGAYNPDRSYTLIKRPKDGRRKKKM